MSNIITASTPIETELVSDAAAQPLDIVGNILALESGELTDEQINAFFQDLINNDLVDGLGGSYRRFANALIAAGRVTDIELPPVLEVTVNNEPTPAEIAQLNSSPFVGIENVRKVAHGEFVYFIFTYKGYNCGGFTAYEDNGIGIIDEVRKGVLLDEHLKQDSGYYGASKAQIAEVERIAGLDELYFKSFVNSNRRRRYLI
jgi:hypothetical protein